MRWIGWFDGSSFVIVVVFTTFGFWLLGMNDSKCYSNRRGAILSTKFAAHFVSIQTVTHRIETEAVHGHMAFTWTMSLALKGQSTELSEDLSGLINDKRAR
jgi:hypothetical protein